jgi:4'-phosphopantetheinyl transferase
MVAPRNPILRGDELHVWLSMTGQGPQAQSLLDVLSTEEIERARRFHFSRDRERFIRARGVLRTLLGRYAGADPAGLRFCSNDYGKPALAGEWAETNITFNLSHSHKVILYAFALKREVGIDVEHIRPELAGEDVAARFFAAPEAEALRRTPAEARAAAFFSCWTRKEAYVKARGEGLSLPLDRFVVSIDVEAREVALDVCGDAGENRRWNIISLRPAEGYVAALAAEGSGWQVKYWRADI